jgi:hypothetical protein
MPPRRLVATFGAAETGPLSVVRFDIAAHHDILRLNVTHDDIPDAKDVEAAAAVLSNLKSLLETGTYFRRHRGRCTPTFAPNRCRASG